MAMGASDATSPVLCIIDQRGVASVTLNRPHVNNAYDGSMIRGLLDAMDALDAAGSMRAVVIRGNGRHFQAGADLNWTEAVAKGSPADNIAASRDTAEAMRRLNRLAVPTLALVQGGCFGGGTGLIAACDIVVAAENAMFSIAEIRWGLTAAIILPQLNAAMGARQLRRYALTGERFGAAQALRIGLVHEVVAAAELESTGARFVDHILENAPAAIAETKALALDIARGNGDERTLRRLVESHALKRQSPEAAEGLASFRERRQARW
jgi:methylglutaconyl-CoA hydratase